MVYDNCVETIYSNSIECREAFPMNGKVHQPKDSGQAILEFALILPLLVLLILGIAAFGQMFSHQLILNNATREGARLGIICKTDPEIDAIIRDRSKTLAHYSDPTYLEVYINPPDGSPLRVTGNPLTVQVRYKDYIAVPIAGIFMNPKILISRTVMRIEPCVSGGGSSSGGSSSSSGGTSSSGGVCGNTNDGNCEGPGVGHSCGNGNDGNCQ